MSLRLRLLRGYLRRVEKPWLARVSSVAKVRAGFERSARLFRDPPFVCYLPDVLAGVPCVWAQARPRQRGVILHFHGGVYLVGSPATHRAMLARLSALTGMRALLPDYRLAPEHRYPAALEDARTVWDALIARGYRADEIILCGDSAGGGLMLALLSRLLADGQRPAAAVALSPWTDLTLTGASLKANAARDPLLPVERMEEARDHYLAGADPADPGVSPLFADYPDCPPVFLQTAKTEVLRDDTLRLAERLQSLGVVVELDLWGHLPHVWPIFQGWLPEADEALARVAAFMTARLPSPPPSGS